MRERPKSKGTKMLSFFILLFSVFSRHKYRYRHSSHYPVVLASSGDRVPVMFCVDRDMTLHFETDPDPLSLKHKMCATFLAKFVKLAMTMYTMLWDWS